MTLYRQLLVTMLLLFIMLFVTAYSVQFSSTRNYLAQQQETTVINTATSLGLALTPYLETSDNLGAESVINAVFDGGFYRKIQLELLAANKDITRENVIPPQNVPDWFINLGLFDSVSYDAVLTSGWLQLGKLTIEGHPGQAYYQLWQGMSQLATWFVLCFVVAWGLLVLALRYFLKPLHDIELQAHEIERQRFGHVISLPNTRELREVVKAINSMSGQLEVQFKEQADEAERLRHRAFSDPTSGLGNRAFFVSQSQSWISDGTGGAVLLIAVDILEKLDQEEGFTARDQMIKAIANDLQKLCQRFSDFALSRLSAREFALLVPESDIERLSLLGEEINRQIAEQVIDPVNVPNISVIGIAVIQDKDESSQLLTRADHALNKARMEEAGAVVIEHSKREHQLGRLAWKKLIETALTNDLFELSSQAVCDIHGTLLHEEVYMAIRNGNTVYGAGSFLPMVEQFKLGERLDLHIIERTLNKLVASPSVYLAVNLTQHSCEQAGFWHQLDLLLAQYPNVCSRLLLELPEKVFVFHKNALMVPLASLNVAWGIDHFGRHFDLLTQLSDLSPHYVKLDHSFTSNVAKADYDDAFLAAVCRSAHSMGAVTIATRVETEPQLEVLKTLYVDAYQGFVSPPQKWV
ncbi:bifunctional diguanylate cyclase/phosphodiesterase [Oceanisphaera pacifica]|uniref:EAL domain-containing protein n=1 Tax=Oceanisphaera pacifica TaxID=2818389 RepID=A0ABS3ND67_9GAMM|nr:LapD/MoxY N-terminal periplasmic domain-containing protein [Oceanisphaera pacifica]MBO1518549.1 EAL domain-containing protein [Oceanisphaera pacifica]